MNSNDVHKEPSDVAAEEGAVFLDGPNGVATSLTPDAAEESGRRLLAAADKARGQAKRAAAR